MSVAQPLYKQHISKIYMSDKTILKRLLYGYKVADKKLHELIEELKGVRETANLIHAQI